MEDETTPFFVKSPEIIYGDSILTYLCEDLRGKMNFEIDYRGRIKTTPEFWREFYAPLGEKFPERLDVLVEQYSNTNRGVIDLALISGNCIVRVVKNLTGPTEFSENPSWTIRGFFGRQLFGEEGYELPNTIVHASSDDEVINDLRVLKKYYDGVHICPVTLL